LYWSPAIDPHCNTCLCACYIVHAHSNAASTRGFPSPSLPVTQSKLVVEGNKSLLPVVSVCPTNAAYSLDGRSGRLAPKFNGNVFMRFWVLTHPPPYTSLVRHSTKQSLPPHPCLAISITHCFNAPCLTQHAATPSRPEYRSLSLARNPPPHFVLLRIPSHHLLGPARQTAASPCPECRHLTSSVSC